MNIAIIEDNIEDCLQMQNYITQYGNTEKISVEIQTFHTGADFLTTFQPKMYDIIFLDNYLPTMQGMDIAHKIREQDNQVLLIFTSISPDFAVESFEVRAFHYIVKPFDYDKFSKIMRLCCQSLFSKSRYMEVRESRMTIRVPLSDIIYMDSYNHYIHLHTTKRIVKSYMPFREAANLLLAYPGFLLCYRNCILNMDYVTSFHPNYFLMNNGEKLPFSLAKRSSIKEQFLNYEFQKLEKNHDIS